MTSKSTSEKRAAGKRQWRVRTEKGDVFGPADLATLQAWARDGRLAPTHQICADGATWEPVTALRELEMDWVAEVTSGSFYGPIHRDAMNELLRDLYAGKFDPLRAMIIRDVYELMEKVVDRCHDTGNMVMHIVLKNS